MEVAVRLVGGLFAKAAIRGTAVVVNIAVRTNDFWKYTFVDVTGGEICLAEVRVFVGVVQV